MKEIKNYDGRYSVSPKGFVVNNETGRVLKPDLYTLSKGRKVLYYRITLSKNNIQERFALHRLVASYYLDNPEDKPEVNHKDGDRTNNAVGNLEWATVKENNDHATEMGLHPKGEGHGNAKYTEDHVHKVLEASNAGFSRSETAEYAGVTLSFVKDIRGGRTWRHIVR
jgi:hypothetical protein